MKQQILSMILTGFCCCATAAQAQEDSLQDDIGVFTAVVGAVTVAHPGAARVQPVKLHDEVLFKDVIETHTESRTKAFFEDDSVLTVGENSRVEITEHIYNPDQNHRRMVVNLVRGKLRALVSKVFKGAGSKFEIHTPTAVAAARGTYFVVWTERDTTGIVNIGESGRVDFTAGGLTVTVAPGEYSVVGPEGLPTPPAVYDAGSKASGNPVPGSGISVAPTTTEGTLPPQPERTPDNVIGNIGETMSVTVGTVNNTVERLLHVVQAIEGTVLKDMPKPESAIEIVRAILPVLPMSPTIVTSAANTIAGSTGTLPQQILSESSSGPDGLVTPIASITSSLTSTVSSVLAPVSSALTSVTSALAPVTSLVSTVVAPVTPVVSTVLSPFTPVVSAVVAPVTPVVSVAPVAPVTAVISPVIAPVVSAVPIVPPAPSITPIAPVTPVTPVLPVTPPAVISGVTGALGLPIK